MMQTEATSVAKEVLNHTEKLFARPERRSYIVARDSGTFGLDFAAWRGMGLNDTSGRRARIREDISRATAIAPPWAPTKEGKARLVNAKLANRKQSQSAALEQLRQWEPQRERAKRIAARRKAARKSARGAQ